MLRWETNTFDNNGRLYVDPSFRWLLTFRCIRAVLKWIRRIESGNDFKWKTIGNITCTGVNWLVDEKPTTYYYKHEDSNGVALFLKHSTNPKTLGSWWVKEAQSNLTATQRLLEHSIDWAEVIKCKLGYTWINELYFISEWKDPKKLHSLEEILKSKDYPNDFLNRLTWRFSRLKELFHDDFFDFHEHNVWIDPVSEKFYLFDLWKW
jgi:hypothetical protein